MIDTWMRERELRWLAESARLAPHEGAIVELGVYQGATLAALCRAVGDARVVGIDNWQMQYHQANSARVARANLKKLGFKPRIVTGESHKVPEGINRVAMLFIDSDHRREVLYREMAAWLPRLMPGAVVALHDYDNPDFPEMKPAIDGYFQLPTWHALGCQLLLIAFRYRP
jgi:predicted O-methyltransferase YrrM